MNLNYIQHLTSHVVKMDSQDPVNGFLYDPDGKRKLGRRKLRSRDGVQLGLEEGYRWRGLFSRPGPTQACSAPGDEFYFQVFLFTRESTGVVDISSII